MSYPTISDRNILRINDIYRSIGFRIAIESGRRIDLKRRTNNQQYVRSLNGIDCGLNFGNGLAEPDYMRSELCTIGSKISYLNKI